MLNEVYLVAAKRTPIGGFMGSLSHLRAPELGALAIRAAYQAAGVDPETISSVYLGNVLSANLGQSPARQASKLAGIPDEVDCTSINKVCAAGMKAVQLGAQQIQLGLEDLVMTGGMESMSTVPHYSALRIAHKLGDQRLVDGLLQDGLTDAFHSMHMGKIAEMTVRKHGLTREEQDAYALRSYAYAQAATQAGKYRDEVLEITLVQRSGDLLFTEDEDIRKVIVEKVQLLKPSFDEHGTITAANASNINDGAAALLLASGAALEKYNLKPLAKMIAYADAALAPEEYATAPSAAIKKVLERANLSLSDMDFIELNEAYAAVVLANQKILGFDL